MIASGLAACAAPASARTLRPAASISVLVDLSETWNNPASATYNRTILRTVGNGIATAAVQLPKPLMVRYHAIGQDSLGQAPLCSIDYRKSIFGFSASGLVTDEVEFRRQLTAECPRYVLAQRPQGMTEITAALVSAMRATAMGEPGMRRVVVILSDFKEETHARYGFDQVDLRGVRVVMLYRTLPEDRRDPRLLDRRISLWRRRLFSRGALVAAYDENAARSPADVAAAITEGR